MIPAGGLGLLDRGVTLAAPGLGLLADPLDLLMQGAAVPLEPGMDIVEPLLPLPRLGLGSGLLIDEPPLDLTGPGLELLVPRLRGLPLLVPPASCLFQAPGVFDAGRFTPGGLLRQEPSRLVALGTEPRRPVRARQAIGLQAVPLDSQGIEPLDRATEPRDLGRADFEFGPDVVQLVPEPVPLGADGLEFARRELGGLGIGVAELVAGPSELRRDRIAFGMKGPELTLQAVCIGGTAAQLLDLGAEPVPLDIHLCRPIVRFRIPSEFSTGPVELLLQRTDLAL